LTPHNNIFGSSAKELKSNSRKGAKPQRKNNKKSKQEERAVPIV
jgi:hypothetical protein